jgi:uncharacterized protein YdhG (YjbR/CyaY superfamily)
MRTDDTQPKSIDEYIAGFPPHIQELLQAVRRTIGKAAPDAHEAISYQMPTFVLKGNLVHFAAFKNHIGFFPSSTGVEQFKDRLSAYSVSKGTIRLPLDRPIPFDLIGEIVEFRVKENLARAEAKRKKKEPELAGLP